MDSVSPELKEAIAVIKTAIIKDCDSKRKIYMPIWQRAEYYWNDIQDIFLDPNTETWLTFDPTEGETEVTALENNNKIANVYRADGESLIAAATVGNLGIRFYPQDAENIKDVEKARSYTDIAEYLQIQNKIRDLRRRTFTIRYNQGLVGSYVYYETDKKYGTVEVKDISEKTVLVVNYLCQCGETQTKQYDNEDDIAAEPVEDTQCPECGMPMENDGEMMEQKMEVVGTKEEYKGCSIVELYSPLEMRVPFYAKTVDKIDYVVIQSEVHYTEAMALLLQDSEDEDSIEPNTIDNEAYDREQHDYYGNLSSDSLVTITYVWALPNWYNVIARDGDKKKIKELMKKYPEGLKATFIKDKVFRCKPESLKARWSFIRSPLDSHVYCRALGNGTIPIQDMLNDMIFLILDTIRHSVGDTWVDFRIINQNVVNKMAQKPGNYLPVFTEDNRPIQEYFYSSKNATLSKEVDSFMDKLEQLRQLVSGIFPSIFGGRFEGGSQTFGEYKLSRDQALQRISMPADNVDDFMAETFSKATELYADNMKYDEKYSVDNGPNSYMNKTLRKPHKDGKISRVLPMRSEQFPVTWEQQRAFIMELLGMNKEAIDALIFAPENISIAGKVIGIPGMKIPGENDRNKQLIEIQRLLNEEPIPGPDKAMLVPSVRTDKDIDNDDVHIATAIQFCVSPEGMYQQRVNPKGFQNVIAHIQEHKFNVKEKQVAEMPPDPTQAPPPPNNEAAA